MKKKLIALTLLVVLVVSVALTGCTFIKVNNERKANEIMATVSIDNNGQPLSLNVTRNELVSYVNYIISLYNNYGMKYDAKTLVTQGLDSLINQKYLILQGMVYLSGIEGRKEAMYANTDEYKAVYGDKLTPEGVLTVAERYASIKSTNESFVKDIESYVKDYDNEKRELVITNAKEELAARYKEGYKVKENGVSVAHETENGYADGLYQTSFVAAAADKSSDKSSSSSSDKDKEKTKVEVDYTKIILKITLEKSGSDDAVVYLPVASTSVTTEDDGDAAFVSNYVASKICKVTYEEPQTKKGEETSYLTHTAEADFTLVTPRTTYVGPESDDKTDLINGKVKNRYATLAEFKAAAESEEKSDLKTAYQDGQIFAHTLTAYESDAYKDAYRQFREAKKNMNINFTATINDSYNGLGYYYLSSFESAVLTAVQHELKKAALTSAPVTDEQIEAQYKVLVEKQKEEYSILDNKAQIEKFASTVKSDLTSAYYVPIDALKAETFEYNGNTYNYATDNGDGTYTINMFYIAHILFKWSPEVSAAMERYLLDRKDEEIKDVKTLFVKQLETNKSKLTYATAEKETQKLEDAFFLNEDGTIAEFSVLDVLAEMKGRMEEDGADALAIFKEYMTYFNDDGGTMSSKLGYFVPFGDIAHGYDGDDFPNMARDLYLSYIAEGKDPAKGTKVSGYAFTSYGLHIEYISFAPFYKITLDGNSGLGINKALDLDGSTFAATIKDSLESKVASTEYTNWSKKYSSEKALESATKDNKKMKALLKDLGLK